MFTTIPFGRSVNLRMLTEFGDSSADGKPISGGNDRGQYSEICVVADTLLTQRHGGSRSGAASYVAEKEQ